MRAEDTLQYMSDFYPSIFPTRKHALDHLFCVVGNGYEWKDGELVDCDDKYEKRYQLREHISEAEFPNEDEWYRMYDVYNRIANVPGVEEFTIPVEYTFRWYPLSKQYSKLYTAPDDIKDDWKKLLEECKGLLIQDGIQI